MQVIRAYSDADILTECNRTAPDLPVYEWHSKMAIKTGESKVYRKNGVRTN